MAGKFLQKLQKLWNPPDDEYDDYYEEEEASEVQPDEEMELGEDAPAAKRGFFGGSQQSRVVSISPKAHMQMAAFRPMTFGEDISHIADAINQKKTVILNLEKTERGEMRRILDFLSGVAYANDGKIKRVSSGTYVITPYNVDLDGEAALEELESEGIYF